MAKFPYFLVKSPEANRSNRPFCPGFAMHAAALRGRWSTAFALYDAMRQCDSRWTFPTDFFGSLDGFCWDLHRKCHGKYGMIPDFSVKDLGLLDILAKDHSNERSSGCENGLWIHHSDETSNSFLGMWLDPCTQQFVFFCRVFSWMHNQEFSPRIL